MLSFNLGATAAPPANPAISELQTALVGLAQAAGDPRLNPGAVTGTLNDATMIALSIGLGIAIRKTADASIPSYIATSLQYTALTEKARQYTTEYAAKLTGLIRAATIAYTTGSLSPNKPPTSTTPSNLPQVDLSKLPQFGRRAQAVSAGAGGGGPARSTASAPKWYATWWGIGGLIILGGLAIMAFDRNPQA
jgi:hypothetical protein